MPKKKETKTKKEKATSKTFDLDEALNNILNPFLNESFRLYIDGMDIKTEKQFNELYNNFIGGKTN